MENVIFVQYNLLFQRYILVSRNGIFSTDISYLNVIDGGFVFNLFRKFSRSVLLSVHIRYMFSINLRYISETVLIMGYMNFLSELHGTQFIRLIFFNSFEVFEAQLFIEWITYLPALPSLCTFLFKKNMASWGVLFSFPQIYSYIIISFLFETLI